MDQLQQQHHVEDVGRILLQTQEQLRVMREQMTAAAATVEAAAAMRQSSSSSVAASDVQAFNDILQRAELELQSKAELVLNGLVHASSSAATVSAHNDRDDLVWPKGMSLPAVAAPTLTVTSLAFRDRSRIARTNDAQELDVEYFRSVRRLFLRFCVHL